MTQSNLQSSMMSPDVPPAVLNNSLADLIGMPGDIPFDIQAIYFPYLSKAMQLSNLSKNDILDIMADFDLSRIEDINGKRRYEITKLASRGDFIRIRSHLIPSLSNSYNGFAVKQLTSVHKHISYDDGRQSKGWLNGIFKKGDGDDGQ